jgi:hypothetical protein
MALLQHVRLQLGHTQYRDTPPYRATGKHCHGSGRKGRRRTRRAAGIGRLVRGLILLPVTAIAGVAAVILYLSKNGPWLYLRVRSDDGDRFAIGLPFPLHLIRGGLRLVQSQVPDPDIGEKIDMAAEFLEAIETSDLQDPMTIDVRDEGDSVQIYFG